MVRTASELDGGDHHDSGIFPDVFPGHVFPGILLGRATQLNANGVKIIADIHRTVYVARSNDLHALGDSEKK